MKEMFEPGERHNIHLEVLKAKLLAHELPEDIERGVEIAVEKAERELVEGSKKLSSGTEKLLKNLYKLVEK